MAKGDRYVKIVEWSDEGGAKVGDGDGGGDDAKHVFAELCELVEETIETLERDGKPLPQPLSGREFVNLMQRSA